MKRHGQEKEKSSCFNFCFGVKEPISRISIKVKAKVKGASRRVTSFRHKRQRVNSISEKPDLELASVRSGLKHLQK